MVDAATKRGAASNMSSRNRWSSYVDCDDDVEDDNGDADGVQRIQQQNHLIKEVDIL